MSVEYDSRRTSLTNLSITTERMEPFNHMGSDGMGMRNYSPSKKYIQGNLIKGAIAALVFILFCIICYLLTSVHHLQSQVRDNEALLNMLNKSELGPIRNSGDFQELKRRFDLIDPSVNDAENGVNDMRTKFDNMQEQLDNLETNLEKALINIEEHMNGTDPPIHVDSLINSSFVRRMNAFESNLLNVQTLAKQNSKIFQNGPGINSSLFSEFSIMEDKIEKLKHLVTGTNYLWQLMFLRGIIRSYKDLQYSYVLQFRSHVMCTN